MSAMFTYTDCRLVRFHRGWSVWTDRDEDQRYFWIEGPTGQIVDVASVAAGINAIDIMLRDVAEYQAGG